MHANGNFGKTPRKAPRHVYEADTLTAAAARFTTDQWDEHTVIVVPRPDRNGDSNTGVVWKSPDSSLLGAILKRPGSTGGVDCHVATLNELIGARPDDIPVPVAGNS
jgi:hypothetical protein